MKNLKSKFNFFKRIWKKIKNKRKTQFYFLLILSITASFFEAFNIGMILPFLSVLSNPIDYFSDSRFEIFYELLNIESANQIILPITLLFVFITLLSGLIRIFLLWAQTKLSHSVGADFSFEIFNRTLYQSYKTHINRNSSDIIAGITSKANTIVTSAIMPFMLIISSIFITLTITIALFYTSPSITIYSLLTIGFIYLIVFSITKKKLNKNSKIISVESNIVIKTIIEGLGAIRDVIISGSQKEFAQKFKNSDLPMRSAKANIHIISNSPRYIIETIGMILISYFSYLVAIKSNINNYIPIIGAFAFGAQKLLPSLQQIFTAVSSMRGGMDSINDALVLLEQPIDSVPECNNRITFKKQIELNDLCFSYNTKDKFMLNNISLKIKKGSKVGLIGPSGSGKSSLLDLIMGLLTPNKGFITVDQTTLNYNNYRCWQEKISHVPQSIFLTDNSIMENIAFGVPINDINYKKVEIAAKKAQLHSTINSWEKKYETEVGERGVNLSGGQKQRIGIARALYKESEIIIFDEATSALDNDTENSVINSIENIDNSVTIIIVAHRLSTLKKCDTIISLKDGKIEKIGKYSDLIIT